MMDRPARLDLQTAFARSEPRPFHGQITEVVRLGANGGFARYRLIIEPWLSFLGHRQDSYLFQDKSVIDIVDELLADWRGVLSAVRTAEHLAQTAIFFAVR